MNFKNPFARGPKQLDGEAGDDVDDFDVNEAKRKKQLLLLSGGGAVALFTGCMYIFDGKDSEATALTDNSTETQVSTDDMVNKNMSDKEWQAASEARFQSLENQMKGGGVATPGAPGSNDPAQAQLAALQAENQSMASDGQRVMGAYEQENQQLRAALAVAKSGPIPAAAGPQALYGAASPPGYRPPPPPTSAAGRAALAAVSGPSAPAAVTRSNQIKLVAFEGGAAGTATRISGGSTSYTDSENYLPPNSIATARVIVGVDASAGVTSQSDPLPVVLRITGPARSVFRDGKLLTTRIEGCLVNGAARGDLSSEKVYVKLQRMTCPQANGRYAVSDVKGFIAFGGKTGVRGRVVSREGSLAMQAFLSGLVGGAGSALQGAFSVPVLRTETGQGNVPTPDLGNVGLRALGGGAEETGKTVSKYLIERAEQYQPVIEMPTGVDVEIVFLEGVFIQN